MGSINWRIISDVAQWDALEDAWGALFARSPYASTAMRFGWMRQWWRNFGEHVGPDGLRIVTLWEDGDMVGVLPLYLRPLGSRLVGPRCLGFVSTGEAVNEEVSPDYLDLMCLAGREAACLAGLGEALKSIKWDVLTLRHVADGSPLLGDMSWCEELEAEREDACAVANLGEGFEAYLAGLSSKTRGNARKYLREAERVGAALEFADAANVDVFFDELVRLHQLRWEAAGKSGCFSSERFAAFHRALTRAWVPGGESVLARLTVAGRALAVVYGFVTAKKFDFYQCGMDASPDGPLTSPGITVHYMLMPQLAARGITRYDFLHGQEGYKSSLAREERAMYGLESWKSTPAAIAYRSYHKLGRVVKRALNAPT